MKPTINQRKARDPQCWVVDWTHLGGKRQRRFFTSKRAAETEAATLAAQGCPADDVSFTLTHQPTE